MSSKSSRDPLDWRLRAMESWQVAKHLVLDKKPPMPWSATSRLYYSVYQGLVAFILTKHPTDTISAKHGALWDYLYGRRDAEGRPDQQYTRWGLLVQNMYSWRRKADYAEDDVSAEQVRMLLAKCKPVLGELGVDDK